MKELIVLLGSLISSSAAMGADTSNGANNFYESDKVDTHPIQREFFDFYRTPRGKFTPSGSSPELTTHPTLTSSLKFMNFYPFTDIETISPPSDALHHG